MVNVSLSRREIFEQDRRVNCSRVTTIFIYYHSGRLISRGVKYWKGHVPGVFSICLTDTTIGATKWKNLRLQADSSMYVRFDGRRARRLKQSYE